MRGEEERSDPPACVADRSGRDIEGEEQEAGVTEEQTRGDVGRDISIPPMGAEPMFPIAVFAEVDVEARSDVSARCGETLEATEPDAEARGVCTCACTCESACAACACVSDRREDGGDAINEKSEVCLLVVEREEPPTDTVDAFPVRALPGAPKSTFPG